METIKKLTQNDLYNRIKERCADDKEIVEFCDKKIAQNIAKGGKVNEKKTAEQSDFMALLIDCLALKGKLRCNDFLASPDISSFEWTDKNPTSSQRINAMLKKLVDNGTVKRTTDKKQVYFELA